MKAAHLLPLITAVAAISAAGASVAQPVSAPPFGTHAAALTREQVRQELFEARRLGLVSQNEADEDRWWRTSHRSTRTRAEVRDEFLQAQRQGLVPRNKAEEQRLWQARTPSVLSREQVAAEAVEARRLGLLDHGDGPAPLATPQQAEQIRLAGLRAIERNATIAQRP
jgi:Domain of unknown function (DUF4148)